MIAFCTLMHEGDIRPKPEKPVLFTDHKETIEYSTDTTDPVFTLEVQQVKDQQTDWLVGNYHYVISFRHVPLAGIDINSPITDDQAKEILKKQLLIDITNSQVVRK